VADFLHLIKLAIEPDAPAVSHWTEEVGVFQSELVDRYAASMRHRIDLDQIWRDAKRLRIVAGPSASGEKLPAVCPFDMDDLFRDSIAVSDLVARLSASAADETG
jgi:hypothetical protein